MFKYLRVKFVVGISFAGLLLITVGAQKSAKAKVVFTPSLTSVNNTQDFAGVEAQKINSLVGVYKIFINTQGIQTLEKNGVKQIEAKLRIHSDGKYEIDSDQISLKEQSISHNIYDLGDVKVAGNMVTFQDTEFIVDGKNFQLNEPDIYILSKNGKDLISLQTPGISFLKIKN